MLNKAQPNGVADSGRIQNIVFEFGRIRRTTSNSRIRITREPPADANRIRRIRAEFESQIRIPEFALIPHHQTPQRMEPPDKTGTPRLQRSQAGGSAEGGQAPQRVSAKHVS